MTTISINTGRREEFVDITARVQEAVQASGCRHGVCHVICPHTTAGVTVNENADPDVVHDILLSLGEIVKELRGFRHSEGNSTAHVKSTLVGTHVCLPIVEGRVALGTWQGIYLCEFDGPRRRQVRIVCVSAGKEA
ncbi:MAG: secondary thiamine-phosphate synthase enzyme YjbQ [bacterium]|nr:secondary thiamine-phosphate synthase enzyme YjbQ [bacterium]